ncbi:MAG: penicillin-binding protein 2 [Parachlamydiaceae bacterium]|nr:penicillin-binding protein 2 [Parachlamydiaceae bacterium]
MKQRPPPPPIHEQDRLRLLIVVLGIVLLLSLLVMQYYFIQLAQFDHWTKLARRQHFFSVDEPFIRGSFYSNASLGRQHPDTPQRLVLDIQKVHLYADPASIPSEYHSEVISGLKNALDLTPQQQQKLLMQLLHKKSRSRKLALWLDNRRKEQILNWWRPFARSRQIPINALFFVSDYQRSYPFGKLLGQVIQTVQKKRDERTGQAHPTGGLELSCDKHLKGCKGKRLLMRSPRNSLESGEIVALPENGADVYLTINHVLQAIAEDEIAKAVHRSNAKSGWAVMMHPDTGEILALAQYPYFYPEHYAEYFNDSAKRDLSKVKAVSDANEPGSVMKPVTLAVAFMANEELKRRGENSLFSPDEKMATLDDRFPGRRPLKEITYHRFLNMNMGIWKSSNIYVARLIQRVVERLGNEWYRQVLVEVFGFGQKTGIELPGESAGVVPRPGKMHPNGALEWSVPTPFSLAMGHNVQITSIQLLRAYACLANGGRLVKPTLIRKIVQNRRDGSAKVIIDNTTKERHLAFPKVLDSEMTSQVVAAMKYATKKGGSSFRGDINGYTEAGKTGTSEKIINGVYSRKDHVSTFIGFAPVNKPAFVLLVTIDEPEHGYIPGIGKRHMGGLAAVPAFREIGKRSLAYLGISPDDPYGYPFGDPRYDPSKADWVKEVQALQNLYNTWNLP